MRLSPPARHGRVVLRLSASLAALASSSALAGEAERAPTWDLDHASLVELGLGQSRGDPVPVPHEAPRLRWPGHPQAASQGRIFLNFDGAQLSSGWDDSHTDTTQIGECAGSFAAYGDGAKRDAVVQAVHEDWAPFNVLIVDTRPGSGDYTMCMVGPSNPFGGGVLGIAPLDCDDSQTHNNIVYAFHSVNDGFDASTTATTIGQEVAHSYGLEHVDEPGDVMNPYNAGGDPSFTDQCIGVVGGVVCGGQHAANCGSQSSQNSYQELMNLFGPSAPDTQQPTVSITAPSDGAVFDVGASFEITVDANDDVGIEQVVLFNGDEQIESDASSPYGWTVNNAPAGTYVFHVEASDAAGNVSSSNTVMVTVGDAPADGGADATGGADSAGDGNTSAGGSADGTGGGDGADGTGAGDGGGDGAFDDGGDGSLPPGYGLDDADDQGCACNAPSARRQPLAGIALLLVALGGIVRRRRSSPAKP